MSRPPARVDAQEVPRKALADLGLVKDQIGRQLALQKELGLLSVTVLRREKTTVENAWKDYNAVQREISAFLTRFSVGTMRRTDTVLEPVISGNTFVILLGPPRDERSIGPNDTGLVQQRLRRALIGHLLKVLPNPTVERFGVYVGAALMRHEPMIQAERIIYRCLEEAIADAMSQKRAETSAVGTAVERILEHGSVSSVYQPLVDLGSRSVIGFEALTRVGTESFASPDRLFKAAHESGTLWAVERLCRDRALEALPTMRSSQSLFMNIERDSLEDPELLGATFLRRLREVGLEPGKIVLELTEHSTIDDFDLLRRVLQRFRDCGFRLAMDDVGAGYSGLQAIAEIEPDYLKVDMNLVRNLHLRPVKRELIATIRRFSEKTGTILIAEGVEKPEELVTLISLGVRCAQGFLFAKPGCPPLVPDWQSLGEHL